MIDRPPILIKAPKAGVSRAEWDALQSPDDIPPDEVMDWFTNVDRVVERCNRLVASICWGGEALPVTFPVATRMVAISAAYAGCPYTIDPVSRTGWAEPVFDDWNERGPTAFDPDNRWWQLSCDLLDAAAREAPHRYHVGLPDLNAPGQVVALAHPARGSHCCATHTAVGL